MANYGTPNNNIDNEEADFRRRLNRDIGATLDEPDFRSRRAEIMSQIRIEQAQSPRNVRAIPQRQRGFNPSWIGALAAVFVLLVVAAVLMVTLQSNQANSLPVVGIAPAPTMLASSPSAEINGAIVGGSDSVASKSGAGTVQSANVPLSNSNITPAVAQGAAAQTVEATNGRITAAAAAVIAATAPPAAPYATPASGAAMPPIPTATRAVALASDAPKTPPGGLPAYAGGTFLNIPSTIIQDFLATLVTNQSASQRQTAGLEDLKNFNFSPQISTTTTAEQVVAYYQEEGKKAGYTINLTSLRSDSKLNASWLLLEKPGTRIGILVLEFKETSEPNAIFGAGKLEPGKTVFFFTLL